MSGERSPTGRRSGVSVRTRAVRRGSAVDVEGLVDLHYRVFDEHTHQTMLFGRDFLRAAYRWYCESPEAFALVVDVNGRVEGSVAVNRGSYYRVFRKNLPALASAIVRAPRVVFNKAMWKRLAAFRIKRRPKDGEPAYLAYLTVSPAGREAGAGRDLIEAAIMECRRRGWDEIRGAIHRDNVPARFMYKILGFEERAELNHGDGLIGIRLRTASPSPAKTDRLIRKP